MADENKNSPWGFEDLPLQTNRVNNDPWTPTSVTTNHFPQLPQAPENPLHTMITSESYIESLEKKLMRMKSKNSRGVRATDMIQSLQTVKEMQVANMLGTNQSDSLYTSSDDVLDSSVMQSIQRRLNPDKQALNTLELVPLVNADVLAKVTEDTDSEKTQNDQS